MENTGYTNPMNRTHNAYGNYDDFEKDHEKFLRDQKRVAKAMED